METLTLSQAIIKVAELEKIYRAKLNQISDVQNTTVSYILESDGQKYQCNDEFDFEKEFKETLKIGNTIEALKTEIAKLNNITRIDIEKEDLTIQGGLNRLKKLREQVDIIDMIIEQSKSSKQRRVDAAATSAYYKVLEPNFDKKDMKVLLESINNEILALELSINKANNETVITLA